MSDNPFFRLAPFIQEYIYRHRWTELRDVQVDACRVLFDSDAHLILAASTASGKTEAAFFPILTELYQAPADSVAVLYVGPTKALINDQFYRLEGLLQESHIPLTAWHGDVSAAKKRKLLGHPQGVLQITPESIESLLINHRAAIPRLFADLRYILIDELHLFMNSERGLQLLCQIERIERLTGGHPRRVALSATLGDYDEAERWLRGQDQRPVVTVSSQAPSTVRLALEHFVVAQADDASDSERMPSPDFEHYLFETTHAKEKVLIFANQRSEVEATIALLREMARRRNLPDIYHVHHGSIAAPLREATELAMRDERQRAVVAATITLELGIDIGQLERVVQLGSPFSVSSFLQRLGRSGRRGNPSEMWFICQEAPTGKDMLPQQLPWELLQAIAIVQLYIEERWIEPLTALNQPFSLLYHQTMSTLTAMGELSAADLARNVLTLTPFQRISLNDYRLLLRHLLALDHIEQIDGGGLIVGLAGEKIVRNYRFYAVFREEADFVVRAKQGEIGRISEAPPIGERIALAGRTWEVMDVDHRQRILFVRLIGGRVKSYWSGGGGAIHPRIVERVRRLLGETDIPSYLQPHARRRLQEARRVAAQHEIPHQPLIPLGGDQYAFFPWLGSRAFEALVQLGRAEATAFRIGHFRSPYYLIVQSALPLTALRQAIRQRVTGPDPAPQIGETAPPHHHKFDEFLPRNLVAKAYLYDWLDNEAMQRSLRALLRYA